MLGFLGWNVFGSFAIMMREQGVNLVLNAFFGPVVNAARAIAVQVNSGLLHVVRNITMPVKPQVIQSYASGNLDRAIHLTYTISKLSFVFLYAASLPVLIELDYILKTWLGKNVPDYTCIFVVLTVCMTFFHNLFMTISDLAQASGNIKRFQILTSIAIFMSVPLSYFALLFGADADYAILMTLVSMVIAFAFSLYALSRIIKFKVIEYVKEVLIPIIIVVALTSCLPFIPHYFFEYGFLRLVLVTMSSVCPIMIVFYFLGLNRREKDLVNNILLGIIKKIKK